MSSGTPDSLARDLSGSMLRGLFWTFSGNGANTLLQIGTTMILARLLAPNDFGTMAAAMTIVGFAQLFSQMGVGPSLVQRKDLPPEYIKTGHLLTIASGFLFALIIAGSAPLVARFFRNPDLQPIVMVLASNFIIRGFGVIPQSLMERDLRFRTLALLEFVSFLGGNVICGIALGLLGFGAWTLVVSSIVHSAIFTICVSIRRPVSCFIVPSKKISGDLMVRGGGFAFSQIVNYFALQGDYFIIGRWLGPHALGLYSRAYHIMAQPVTAFAAPLKRVLFSGFSRIQDDPERIRQAYMRSLSIASTGILPVSATAIALGPEVILTLLGRNWEGSIVLFQILALGTYFRIMHKVTASLSQSMGAVYNHAFRQTVYAFLVVIGSWYGRQWGVKGVAWAVLFAMTVHYLVISQLLLSLLRANWWQFLRSQMRGGVLGFAAGLIAWSLAIFLRGQGLPPPVVLILAGSLTIGAFVALGALMRRWVLGEAGIWLIDNIALLRKPRVQP